jgi:PAS domain S-box-containing protein
MGEGDAIVILLVEDDPTDTRLLLSLLDHADVCRYSVTAVATVAEAERVIADGAPDVVLLDLSLPDCDGVASVERVLAAAPRLPVVVLTGRDDYSLGLRSIEAGAQDFLVKGEAKGNAILRCAQWAVARARTRPAPDAESRWDAVERSAVAVALIGQDLTLRTANDAFATLVGCPEPNLAGRPVIDLIHDDEVVGVVLDLRSTLHGETPTCRRTIRLRETPDAPVVFHLARVDPEGAAPPQLLLLALPG